MWSEKLNTACTQIQDGLRRVDRLSEQMNKPPTNLTVVNLFNIDSVHRVNQPGPKPSELVWFFLCACVYCICDMGHSKINP